MRLLGAILLGLIAVSRACHPTKLSVNLFGDDKGVTSVADKFNASQVQAHGDHLVTLGVDDYMPDGHTTLGCVDARADVPVHGTPGGDLAEFAIALTSYYKMQNIEATKEDIQSKFQQFKKEHISASRPFYYHSDDSKLKLVYQNLSAVFGRVVTVLPDTTPSNETEKTWWLQELSQSYAQGCGHLRLMIGNPQSYGLPNSFIVQSLIQTYIEEWWAASTEAEKATFAFEIKLGSLTGKAIGVVLNAEGTCKGYTPAVTPNYYASSIFVYTPASAGAFRQEVLAPFFTAQTNIEKDAFVTESNKLFDTQLKATLTLLSPANAVNLYTMEYTTEGSVHVHKGDQPPIELL